MVDKYIEGLVREVVNAKVGVWQTYTPTVSASGGGTLTTVTATGQFKEVDGLVFGQATITVTDIGTGTGTTQFTPPTDIDSAWLHLGTYRESNLAGTLGSLVRSGTNLVNIARYDNAAVMANGAVFSCSFMYRNG